MLFCCVTRRRRASGFQDGHIDGTHTVPTAQIALSDWVNALAVAVPPAGDEQVVAGCKDGGIYVLAWSGGPAVAAGVKGGTLVVTT